jgi:hypothetical protein
MLPIKNYQAYTDMVRAGFHTADSLLSDFCADYPSMKATAARILNGMYQPTDYPSDIASRYSWGVEYNPVPNASDFRVSLPSNEIAAIAARTEERVKAAFQDAMTGKDGAVTRLYEVVEKIQAKLSEPDGIFRDTLIGNARELCDILTRLNVTDDPKLEVFRRQTELLAASEPQTLRDVPEVRVNVANEAQSILDAMVSTYGASVFNGGK